MSILELGRDLQATRDQVRTMRDVMAGVDAIKSAGVRYLAMPDATNDSDDNKARYDIYKQRAQWLPATKRTIKSAIGAIFRIKPSIEIPESIMFLAEDADGAGNSIEQLSKSVVSEVLSVGRCGLFVDFPSVDDGLSIEQFNKLNLRPNIIKYDTEQIYKWRTRSVGGVVMLDMVVLCETVEEWQDEFTPYYKTQYRALIMRDGVYTQEIYNERGELEQSFTPIANGKTMGFIPFAFAGAEDNKPDATVPPLYDLAKLNIGHYCNSADFEEAAFIVGQPTMFMASDMSSSDFLEANPNGIKIGSRTGHFLGPNGSAFLLQAEANNLARQAMLDKEEQMRSVGAKLFVQSTGNETAEAARIRSGGEVSVLTTIVGNVSEAIEECIEWCAVFIGADSESVQFALNEELLAETLTAQDITALMGLQDKGTIAEKDVRIALRKAGLIDQTRTDDEIDSDVMADGLVIDTTQTSVA